jgi:hypothetical protein
MPASAAAAAERASALDTVSSCAVAKFVETGVQAVSVNPPFTLTLTDQTPSTGQSTANGVVDVAGIHGHRIEKEISLQLDVKDAGGQTPAYGVLVHMKLGGPNHGKLILDPTGCRVRRGDVCVARAGRPGQPEPTASGAVDAAGIHGHGIEKEISPE